MPNRITGLASGLDIDTLVKQLMMVKRVPVDRMGQSQQTLVWKRDSYREMNTLFSSLKDSANALRFSSTVAAKKATVSNSTAVSATATAGAAIGATTLTVRQMASGAAITSNQIDSTTTLTASDVTLTIGTTNITIAANSKVQDVVNEINKNVGATGVSASYDTTTKRLYFNTTKTGASAAINITGDATLISNLNLPATSAIGKNAIVDYNGVSNIEYETNSFSLNNINFQILQPPAVDSGTGALIPYNVTVTVSADTDKTFDSIKSFIDTYNDVIDKVYNKTHEEHFRSFKPLTADQKKDMKENEIDAWEEKAKSGLLQNDLTLNTGLSKMRELLAMKMTNVSAGSYDTLFDIGISSVSPSKSANYKEHGKLYIDEDKLRSALASNPDQILEMFTKPNTTRVDMVNGVPQTLNNEDGGFAVNLYNALTSKMNDITKMAGSSVSVSDSSTLSDQISKLSRKIELENSKMSKYEQQYYSQFSKLETAMQKANSQSSWIAQSFSSGS